MIRCYDRLNQSDESMFSVLANIISPGVFSYSPKACCFCVYFILMFYLENIFLFLEVYCSEAYSESHVFNLLNMKLYFYLGSQRRSLLNKKSSMVMGAEVTEKGKD